MADKINNMGAYHLSKNSALYEPARSNNFRFIVKNLGDSIKLYDDANMTFQKPQEYLEFSVISASVPTFSQSVIEIRRGNSVMKVAGIPTFSSGSLRINDFIGADGKSILLSWQSLSYNPTTERVGHMVDYKWDCALIEYDPSDKIVRVWDLYGCWVNEVTMDEFNKENGDKRTVTATIQYDWAKMSLSDDITA